MTLKEGDVQWVVNSLSELGVKIGDQFFFLYKGRSIIYDGEREQPMLWRPVFKREFGECAHPINYTDLTKVGKVSLNDSPDWQPLPVATANPEVVLNPSEEPGEGPRDDLPDWSKVWICTQPDDGWSQHDGDRYEITHSGVALFYDGEKLTGACATFEDIFRKDLLDKEWLYYQGVEERPKPEPKEKAFTVDIDIVNRSDTHPTDVDGFYAVTDCLPESVIIIDEHDPYVTLKYADGSTEAGIYLVDTKEFKRSRFSFATNLAFAKTTKEVVGWKYR